MSDLVQTERARLRRLKIIVDGLFPGRWEGLLPVMGQELKATTILSMPIDEGSAKVRTGPPVDDEEDYALDIWAGVIPIEHVVGEPIPCERLAHHTTMPDHVSGFRYD